MYNALKSFIYSRKGIYGVLHVIILILSLFLVISISIDTFHNISFLNEPDYMKIQLWICIFFLFDFFLELFLSKEKMRYIKTHFLFFLISIPYLNIMQYHNFSLSQEVDYLIRFVPLIRGGYAMAIVVGWFSASRVSNLFRSYISLLLVTIYFASLIFYVHERDVNSLVKNYWDALWWASMDVTTVGSNIIAVTGIGKILSVMLAAIGMMMFPIFTVYVTSLVERNNKLKPDISNNDDSTQNDGSNDNDGSTKNNEQSVSNKTD